MWLMPGGMPENWAKELAEAGRRFWHKEDWVDVIPLTPEQAQALAGTDQAIEDLTRVPLVDGVTVVNEDGGKQSFTLARFDYVPPEAMILLAECLGFGGRKYGKDNWRKIPLEENIAHAVLHLQKFRTGDRSEPHMVHAFARVCFALTQAVDAGDQPKQYSHPEMSKVMGK